MRIGFAIVLFVTTLPIATAQQRIKSLDYTEAISFYRPRIALADDGAVVVAWESLQKLEHTERWQIAMQRFSDTGAADSLRYLDGGAFAVQNVELSFSPDGSLWASMERYPVSAGIDARRQMVVGRYEASGRFVEAVMAQEIAREDPQGAGNTYPRIAAAGSFAIYTDGVRPWESVAPAENRWAGRQDPHKFSGDVSNTVRSWMDIAVRETMLGAAWQACELPLDDPAAGCRVRARFASLDAPNDPVSIDVSPGYSTAYRPSIAMNSSGRAVLVWVDYRDTDQGEIYAQRFNAAGFLEGENIRVSLTEGAIDDNDGMRPEVAMRADGSFLVVWTAHRSGRMQAWGRHYNQQGEPDAPAFLLDPDAPADTGFPDVAANENDYAYTWLAEADGMPAIYMNTTTFMQTAAAAGTYPSLDLTLKGYPNPFSKATTLEYSLEKSGHVTLVVYDLLGREVKKLIDQNQGPGSYHVTLDGDELAMGYYVTKLQQGALLKSQLLIRN